MIGTLQRTRRCRASRQEPELRKDHAAGPITGNSRELSVPLSFLLKVHTRNRGPATCSTPTPRDPVVRVKASALWSAVDMGKKSRASGVAPAAPTTARTTAAATPAEPATPSAGFGRLKVCVCAWCLLLLQMAPHLERGVLSPTCGIASVHQ